MWHPICDDASKKVISFSDGHAHNFFIMVAGKVEFECEAFVERTTTLRILVRCITDWVFFIQLMVYSHFIITFKQPTDSLKRK